MKKNNYEKKIRKYKHNKNKKKNLLSSIISILQILISITGIGVIIFTALFVLLAKFGIKA